MVESEKTENIRLLKGVLEGEKRWEPEIEKCPCADGYHTSFICEADDELFCHRCKEKKHSKCECVDIDDHVQKKIIEQERFLEESSGGYKELSEEFVERAYEGEDIERKKKERVEALEGVLKEITENFNQAIERTKTMARKCISKIEESKSSINYERTMLVEVIQNVREERALLKDWSTIPSKGNDKKKLHRFVFEEIKEFDQLMRNCQCLRAQREGRGMRGEEESLIQMPTREEIDNLLKYHSLEQEEGHTQHALNNPLLYNISTTSHLQIYNLKGECKLDKKLSNPIFGIKRQAMALFRGNLIISGGSSDEDNLGEEAWSAYSLDLSISKLQQTPLQWKQLPNMLQKRISHYLIPGERNIYCLGGSTHPFSSETKLTSDCEAYDSQTNEWKPLPPLKFYYKMIFGCVLEEYLYAIPQILRIDVRQSTTDIHIQRLNMREAGEWEDVLPVNPGDLIGSRKCLAVPVSKHEIIIFMNTQRKKKYNIDPLSLNLQNKTLTNLRASTSLDFDLSFPSLDQEKIFFNSGSDIHYYDTSHARWSSN